MKSRPGSKKYKPLISAGLIFVLAVLTLLAGVFIIVVIAFNINNTWRLWGVAGLLFGMGCIIISALLFILSNIAEDVHYQSYLQEADGIRKSRFHEQVLLELQSINEMLQQNTDHKSHTPYSLTSQNRNPQPRVSKDSLSESGMFDYEAQYKRPASKQN